MSAPTEPTRAELHMSMPLLDLLTLGFACYDASGDPDSFEKDVFITLVAIAKQQSGEQFVNSSSDFMSSCWQPV